MIAAGHDPVLHVTNGDSTVRLLEASDIPGDILPWQDVLHEGPVPAHLPPDELAEIRAAYLTSQGWAVDVQAVRASFASRDHALETCAVRDEVVLWFEHDLYDQLQLIEVLDRLSGPHRPRPGRLTMTPGDDYLGTQKATAFRPLFDARHDVTDAEFAAARGAWRAFRSADLRDVERLTPEAMSPLPHLRAAMRRHLEEAPDVRTGLSRSERQALEVLATDSCTAAKAFTRSHHERETAIFLGDSSFASYLVRMSDVEHPLVAFEGGEAITRAATHDQVRFWGRLVEITANGRDVLAGRADHVLLNGVDRWMGGAQLQGNEVPWRWDADREVISVG